MSTREPTECKMCKIFLNEIKNDEKSINEQIFNM